MRTMVCAAVLLLQLAVGATATCMVLDNGCTQCCAPNGMGGGSCTTSCPKRECQSTRHCEKGEQCVFEEQPKCTSRPVPAFRQCDLRKGGCCPSGFSCQGTGSWARCRPATGTCEAVVTPAPVATCESDADCASSEHCRTAMGGSGISPCLGYRTCVPKAAEGGSCGGRVLPCYYSVCQEGLTCKYPEDTQDVPGVCQKSCTPYTPETPCIALANVHYNAGTCKCETLLAPVNCFADPCTVAKCDQGYTCRSSYWGGCNHQCVKEEVVPTPAPVCTPYTPETPCIALANVHYNAGTCKCETLLAPVNCFADPCAVAKCDQGYTCRSSYWGGCNHQCIKEKPTICCMAMPMCEANWTQSTEAKCAVSGDCKTVSMCCKTVFCKAPPRI